jgi:hypothetical protein
MGMSCTNSGFIGYPVLQMTLPAVAGTALALNMIVENLVMIPLVLALAERGRAASSGGALAPVVLRRLAGNPIVLSLIAGLGVAVAGVGLPAVVVQPLDVLARSSAAVSLIVIGGSLVGLPKGGLRAAVMPVVLGKLLLHPLLVGLFLLAPPLVGWPPVKHDLVIAGVLMASVPAMGIYPILAQRYGVGQVAAVAMLAMTVLSFFTISAALWLVFR